MKVILTGSTGYIGEGVLRMCLENENVTKILSISRRSCGYEHEKLEEYIVPDLQTLQETDERLQGYDAVFFCAGISSVGMSEEDYKVITETIPLHLAEIVGPKENMTFIYLSGNGADSTETSKTMWERVKGRAENKILALPFKQSFAFRPSIMTPMSNMKASRASMFALSALYPFLRPFSFANPLSEVGKAMIACALNGYEKKIITPKDIYILANPK